MHDLFKPKSKLGTGQFFVAGALLTFVMVASAVIVAVTQESGKSMAQVAGTPLAITSVDGQPVAGGRVQSTSVSPVFAGTAETGGAVRLWELKGGAVLSPVSGSIVSNLISGNHVESFDSYTNINNTIWHMDMLTSGADRPTPASISLQTCPGASDTCLIVDPSASAPHVFDAVFATPAIRYPGQDFSTSFALNADGIVNIGSDSSYLMRAVNLTDNSEIRFAWSASGMSISQCSNNSCTTLGSQPFGLPGGWNSLKIEFVGGNINVYGNPGDKTAATFAGPAFMTVPGVVGGPFALRYGIMSGVPGSTPSGSVVLDNITIAAQPYSGSLLLNAPAMQFQGTAYNTLMTQQNTGTGAIFISPTCQYGAESLPAVINCGDLIKDLYAYTVVVDVGGQIGLVTVYTNGLQQAEADVNVFSALESVVQQPGGFATAYYMKAGARVATSGAGSYTPINPTNGTEYIFSGVNTAVANAFSINYGAFRSPMVGGGRFMVTEGLNGVARLSPTVDYTIQAGCVDSDGDGFGCVNEDKCPSVAGPYQGCPVGDKVSVNLHVVDKSKTYCRQLGLRQENSEGDSCKTVAVGAEVKVFDRAALATTVYGKEPKKEMYPTIFEDPAVQSMVVATCTTDSTGTCIAGKTAVGNYLEIVKYTQNVLPLSVMSGAKTVYVGHKEDLDDFKNGVAEKKFKTMLTCGKDGKCAMKPIESAVVTGSYLEIDYPQYAIWSGTEELYPFQFTSDSEWTVDLCLQVPTGYKIVEPAECTQILVAGEPVNALFIAQEIGSPEPNSKATFKFKHKGKTTKLDLEIPGKRKGNKK